MKKRVLYADPKINESRAFLQALAELEPEWEIVYASTSNQALARLQSEPFDAVVAELKMPEIDGARLLNDSLQYQPRALRFVLFDTNDRALLLKCLGTAHRFLARPCDAETLQSALRRAFALDVWLPSESVARLLGEMTKLPSPPHLYFKIARELRSATASLEDIGEWIARDPAMTAKVLRAVNSAVFGLGKQVANPSEAVLFLGVEATQAMILLAHTYSYFDQMPGMVLTMDKLWGHSVAVGCYARWIATEEGMSEHAREEAFTAGMLHDIGKLILAANLTERYRQATRLMQQKHLRWWEAEQEIFGVNHAETGACLAAVWGLPTDIVEAMALHHHPTLVVNNGLCPLTVVHAANALEHADAELAATPEVDLDYLAQIGLAGRVSAWRELCRLRQAAN
jgi:putative nucleotidyltransferase with HDIG domain